MYVSGPFLPFISQRMPVYGISHEQWKPLGKLMHVAPFMHGVLMQGMSTNIEWILCFKPHPGKLHEHNYYYMQCKVLVSIVQKHTCICNDIRNAFGRTPISR